MRPHKRAKNEGARDMKREKISRKRYDREFILHAVRLCTEEGRKVYEVAKTLGLHPHMLYRWKEEHQRDPANAFPGKGHLKPEELKIRELQKELYSVRQQRDILKKAVAIFSKEPQKYTSS